MPSSVQRHLNQPKAYDAVQAVPEVLAIVDYRQPTARSRIEFIRGVGSMTS